MNKYQVELESFRDGDIIQGYDLETQDKGYHFIPTAAHGYLVVPREDKNAGLAKNICKYGYVGKHAFYLEEDCEVLEFLEKIK